MDAYYLKKFNIKCCLVKLDRHKVHLEQVNTVKRTIDDLNHHDDNGPKAKKIKCT